MPNEYIDIQKLKSSMILNLGDSSGNFMFKGPKSIMFLTSSGNVITNEYNFLTDEMIHYQNNTRGKARFDHIGTIMWTIIKYLQEVPEEHKKYIKKYFTIPDNDECNDNPDYNKLLNNFDFMFEESINTLEWELEYVKQLICDMNENKLFMLCMGNISENINNIIPPDLKKDGFQVSTVDRFMKLTKLCRVNIVHKPDTSIRELNLSSHHLLSYSQRKILLEIIEMYSIPTDKIFIDDYSKEKTIKRQLRLNFY